MPARRAAAVRPCGSRGHGDRGDRNHDDLDRGECRPSEGVALVDLLAAIEAEGANLRAIALNDYAVDIPVSDAVEGGPRCVGLPGANGETMSLRDKGPLWVIVARSDSSPEYQTEQNLLAQHLAARPDRGAALTDAPDSPAAISSPVRRQDAGVFAVSGGCRVGGPCACAWVFWWRWGRKFSARSTRWRPPKFRQQPVGAGADRVDLLILAAAIGSAARRGADGTPTPMPALRELRSRFDIFYSRVNILTSSPIYAPRSAKIPSRSRRWAGSTAFSMRQSR